MLLEITSIKEIFGLHRMGHTCANLNGELLFVWGGSNDEDQDNSTSNNNRPANSAADSQLWIYETVTGYWRRRTCSGQCPGQLSGTSSALIGRRMFVFGGHSSAQDNWLNTLYCLDLDTFEWRDVGSGAAAEPTKPIPSDKCVSWAHNGRLFVFGGYGWSQTEHLPRLLDRQKDLQLTPDERWPRFGWNNQLVAFDALANKWLWPHYSGGCPSARAAHSGALLGDRYFVFGGRDSYERLNDLYCLQMSTMQWTKLASFSRGPPVSRHLLELRQELEPELEPEQELEPERELVDATGENLIMEADLEELLNPSPSSSSTVQPSHLEPATSQIDMLDSDSDEELTEQTTLNQFGCSTRPPSSHLLKSCSMSSNISTTDLSHTPCFNDLDMLNNETQHDDPSSTENQSQEPSSVASSESQETPATSLWKPEEEAQKHPMPVGRSFASFTAINERDILLYGGVSSQEDNLADCWLLNTADLSWTQLDLRCGHPRLWHTGSRTSNNEVVILGGSASSKVDEFCTDVLTISLSPKSLKRMALDAAARSIRMHIVNRVKGLPSTINKLIKLRKQALAISSRKYYR